MEWEEEQGERQAEQLVQDMFTDTQLMMRQSRSSFLRSRECFLQNLEHV